MKIRLIPIAINPHGEILFKTIAERSAGSHLDLCDARLGLLVVSSKGVWEELLFKSIQCGEVARKDEKAILEAQIIHDEEMARFNTPIYWDSPPIKWRPLLEKYGFKPANEIPPDLGKGRVSWSPNGLFRGQRRIAGPTPQRTLFNQVSLKERPAKDQEASPCKFFSRGVALFQNNSGERGALFGNTPEFFPTTEVIHPFDPDEKDPEVMEDFGPFAIDGICIVPEK